jgi:Putative RNA methylase family UPF0020
MKLTGKKNPPASETKTEARPGAKSRVPRGDSKSDSDVKSRGEMKSPKGAAAPAARPRNVDAHAAESERIGYLLQCSPGLAKVLQKELNFAGATVRDQKMFVKLQRNHDLLFLNHVKSEEGLPKLRTAESVLRCPAYGRFKISQRQLGLMADELKSKGTRRLVVTVAGKVFQRQDLARFLKKAMSERGYEFDDEVEEEVWMFCIDESWYFGLPLFKARSQREDREAEREGSLPPTIAAAMAFAAMPKDDDVVIDPTCGSGTLLSELRAYAPNATLIGCDIDPRAVEVAKANLKSAPSARIVNCDSTKLSTTLPAALKTNDVVGKFTLTLANLPFGVQFGDRASNPTLYRDVIGECLQIADPEKPWRGIFLTSDTESFEKALKEVPGLARPETLFKVKIRGELATAYRLKQV